MPRIFATSLSAHRFALASPAIPPAICPAYPSDRSNAVKPVSLTFLSSRLHPLHGRPCGPSQPRCLKTRLKRSCLWSLILGSIASPLAAPAWGQTSPGSTGTGQKLQFTNEAQYSYSDPSKGNSYTGTTNTLELSPDPLIDPLGRILGCNGEPLADYSGFSVSLYEPSPSDPTSTELGNLLSLTGTELPDLPNNGIFGGLSPNSGNLNPFLLSNLSEGTYNFLFDPNRGQTEVGKTYILVISPPANGSFIERRIKIEIISSINNNLLSYRATSIDGQPISADGGTQVSQSVVLVPNAEQVGLDLLSLQLATVLCEPNQITISKTADRATASPGDIVLYRLAVRNQSDVAISGLTFSDRLPRGLKFLDNSVRAVIDDVEVALTTSINERTATLTTLANLPPQGVMNVIYAARVTPDAVRGSGRNTAIVDGLRTDNGFSVKDGPAVHALKIRPGILTNYGVLVGRVFDDKNFDGEQQRNEPGLPNAVIFLQDGNRIVTDENGLFSVANVQPGYHSGVLDLSSVPGYDFAPNEYRRELNSDSRLVRLEPSGMARMNFPVTPYFGPAEGSQNAPGNGSQSTDDRPLLRSQEVQ